MKTKVLVAAAAVATAASTLGLRPALAQVDAGAGRYLAANCANCHGTNGVAKGAMPSLAGQNRERLVEAFRAFRDGKRPATVMHQIAKGYTDPQLEAIADYFASQKAAR